MSVVEYTLSVGILQDEMSYAISQLDRKSVKLPLDTTVAVIVFEFIRDYEQSGRDRSTDLDFPAHERLWKACSPFQWKACT